MLPRCIRTSKGVSLVEVLIGMLIVVLASIGTLTYFSSALGNVNKQGNRRAALERARQRLEQLMETPANQLPPQDGQTYWCQVGNPCTSWVQSSTPISQTGGIQVDDLGGLRMETSAQFVNDTSNDPSGGPPTLDTYELGVKVWFIPNSPADDDFHRVYLKTLRTP